MRGSRWVAAGAATVLVCATSPALATAKPARLTHVTATATPATALIGGRTLIAGAVTPAAAGETVSLQRLVAGHWRPLGRSRTTRLGRYSFSVSAGKKPATLALRVIGTSAHSRTVTVHTTKAAFRVSAGTAESALQGKPIAVTGSTRPVAAGAAQLMVLSHGQWVKVASVGLSKKGSFTLYGFQPLGRHELRVVRPYTRTVATGVSKPFFVTVKAPPVTPPPPSFAGSELGTITSDATTLGLAAPSLVFSGAVGTPLPAARTFTVSNPSAYPLAIGAFALSGSGAGSFALAPGQAGSVTVPANGSAGVSAVFTPAVPTGCPSAADPTAIGSITSAATLTFASSDPDHPSASVALSGLYACSANPAGEPVLDQQVAALGYTTVVDAPGGDRRVLGPLRTLAGSDEVVAPYFTAADPASPVSLTPLAHYDTAQVTPYQSTGWYARWAPMAAGSVCSVGCRQLWQFPSDPSPTTFAQNQRLLPTAVGTASFTPIGSFGLYSGDGSDVAFSDDSLNVAHQTNGAALPVPHYLHDLRVFPAYGPGHAAIPGSYLVAVDNGRVPGSKSNDFQDELLLLTNATPATSPGPAPGAATTSALNVGGTVSATCGVTGFDGVLVDDPSDECYSPHIAFTAGGLALTSSPGQLANNNQQNALYKTFDATQGAFTVTARVVSGISQLTTNYQQIGAFFGPDQDNFVKVEAEHNGTGPPHLTMFYREGGAAGGTVSSVAVAGLTVASTLDLIIKGNAGVADPIGPGDTFQVHGYPLDELTVFYSLNGGTPVQVGSIKSPADVSGWFSPQAKAGIEVSNTGTTTNLTATYSRFAITAG